MPNSGNSNQVIQWLVVLADFILLNVILLALFGIFGDTYLAGAAAEKKIVFLVANASMVIAEVWFHTIIHLRKIKIRTVFKRVFNLVTTQAVATFVILKFMSNYPNMFREFFVYWLLLYLVIMLSRLAERCVLEFYRSRGRNIRTVVLVGNDPANVSVYNELMEDPATGYRVLGYYSNSVIKDPPEGLKKLGDIDNDLFKHLESMTPLTKVCDDLFCSMSHDESEKVVKIMRSCDKNGIHFFYVPRQFGIYKLHLKSVRFGQMEILTNYSEPLLYTTNKFIKRTFDIVFSLIVCLCLLPFIPIIALIIKIQSPGPIFFVQKRTGLNGKTFNCIKFRSMDVNSDADKVQATEDDPRKFAFGNFMRKTNIDELPQFFNVLKGDMSVVGPRPHMLLHTDIYSKLISKYMVRHFSKPGITGLAQVTGYRGETKELWQMEERVKRDIWYIENWSFWLDIEIIFMTIANVFKHDPNAY